MDWSKFNNFKKEISGKKVLILGLGLQGGGIGAVKFFNELRAKLRVTDLKSENVLSSSLKQIENMNIDKISLGENKKEDVDWADIVLVNPGVPHKSEIYKYIENRKKTIFMEEALFTFLSPVETVGITGTRGKTTTTCLIGELLKTKFQVKLAGNIPGSETLMLLLQIVDEKEKVVMELSSFELAGFHVLQVSPKISVFTNLFEDHLNIYSNMEEYLNDKKAIYLYQKENDHLIINKSLVKEKLIKNLKSETKAQIIEFKKEDISDFQIGLPGNHNKENFSAAFHVAKIFDIANDDVIKIFKTFKGVPFRQEKIREYRGVSFINDTTATTPTAGLRAIEANTPEKTIILVGGNSKNCHVDDFAKKVATCKQAIFLKGNATPDFRNKVKAFGMKEESMSGIFDKLESAVVMAYESANPGDTILLSPGFTSFGEFNNEFERGIQFNTIVSNLK